MSKTYHFRAGFRPVAGIKPEQVVNELERIENVCGKIDAPTIVEESTPEDATLHPFF